MWNFGCPAVASGTRGKKPDLRAFSASGWPLHLMRPLVLPTNPTRTRPADSPPPPPYHPDRHHRQLECGEERRRWWSRRTLPTPAPVALRFGNSNESTHTFGVLMAPGPPKRNSWYWPSGARPDRSTPRPAASPPTMLMPRTATLRLPQPARNRILTTRRHLRQCHVAVGGSECSCSSSWLRRITGSCAGPQSAYV